MLSSKKLTKVTVGNIAGPRTTNPRSVDVIVSPIDDAIIDGLDNSMNNPPITTFLLGYDQQVFSPDGYLVLPVWIDESTDEHHYSQMEDASLFTETQPNRAALKNFTVWKKTGSHATQHSIGSPWLSEMIHRIRHRHPNHDQYVDPKSQLTTIASKFRTRIERNRHAVNALITAMLPMKDGKLMSLSFHSKHTTTTEVCGLPIGNHEDVSTDYDPATRLYLAHISELKKLLAVKDSSSYALIVQTENGWVFPHYDIRKRGYIESGEVIRAFVIKLTVTRGEPIVDVIFFPGESMTELHNWCPNVNIMQVDQAILETHAKSIATWLTQGAHLVTALVKKLDQNHLAFSGFGVEDGACEEITISLNHTPIDVYPVHVITTSKV